VISVHTKDYCMSFTEYSLL